MCDLTYNITYSQLFMLYLFNDDNQDVDDNDDDSYAYVLHDDLY